jgi:diacylglycerol kinase family enzyme
LLGDRLGTGLAVLQALLKRPPVDLELEIDGEKVALPRANHLAILKNPFIASGLKLDTGLQPDDGRLFAAGVHGKTRWGLCRTLPSFYSGALKANGSVLVKTCSRITVRAVPSERREEVEFDGDPRGFLPVEIETLPRALNLIGGAP